MSDTRASAAVDAVRATHRAAHITAFMRRLRTRFGVRCSRATRRCIASRSIATATSGDGVGLLRRRRRAWATRVVDRPDKMPGARFFPDARLNFAENLLRRRDDGAGAHLQRRRAAAPHADATPSCAREVARVRRGAAARPASGRATASPATCRTCPRRSSPRSARRRSARSGRRARRTSACRACSTASARSSRACWSPPTATSTAARRTTCSPRLARRRCARCRRSSASSSCPTSSARRRSTACRSAMPWDEFVGAARRADLQFERAAVRPSALHPVFVGHDRRAEVHRPRRRRHADPAPEGTPAALRHPAAATASSTSRPAAG